MVPSPAATAPAEDVSARRHSGRPRLAQGEVLGPAEDLGVERRALDLVDLESPWSPGPKVIKPYGIGFGPPIFTWRDVVCRRPLQPGATELVYDEALDPRKTTAPAPSDHPEIWVRINVMASRLVTGP